MSEVSLPGFLKASRRTSPAFARTEEPRKSSTSVSADLAAALRPIARELTNRGYSRHSVNDWTYTPQSHLCAMTITVEDARRVYAALARAKGESEQ